MKKKEGFTCLVIFEIALIASAIYLIYIAVRSFRIDTAIETVKDLLLGVGVCIGFALQVLAGIYIFGLVSSSLPPARLKRSGKEYQVRVYPSEIDALSDGSIPYYRTEPVNQGPVLPVYLNIAMTNYGLSLAMLSSNIKWSFIPQDNDKGFGQISENHPGRIIVPMDALHLYYVILQKMGYMTIEQRPAKMHGYSGSLKSKPIMGQIQITIIISGMTEAGNLEKRITRKKPIILKLVALKESGQDDPAGTRELYEAVYKAKSKQLAQDDDSWMYQSRPTTGWW